MKTLPCRYGKDKLKVLRNCKKVRGISRCLFWTILLHGKDREHRDDVLSKLMRCNSFRLFEGGKPHGRTIVKAEKKADKEDKKTVPVQ